MDNEVFDKQDNYFFSLFDSIKYSLVELVCLAAVPPLSNSNSIGVIIPMVHASPCLLTAAMRLVRNYLYCNVYLPIDALLTV